MACVVFLVIITMSGVTYTRCKSILNDFLNRAGITSAMGAAENVENRMEIISGITTSAAASVKFSVERFNLGEDELEKLTTSILQKVKNKGIMDIFLGWEATGRLSIGSTWKEPDYYDARKMQWYREAIAAPKGQVIFSKPYNDSITNKLIITSAMAIYTDDNKLLGVLGSDLDIEALREYVIERKIFGHGAGVLLTKDGLIVAHPNKDYTLKVNMLVDSRFEQKLRIAALRMISGKFGYMDYIYAGDEQRLFYAPATHGYYFGVFFPISVIDEVARTLTILLLVISSIAIFITGITVFAIIKSLTASINSLKGTTIKLSNGDMTVSFDESGRNELSHIASALNIMVESVCGVFQSIRDVSEKTSIQAENLASLSEETLALMEEVSSSVEGVNHTIVRNYMTIKEAPLSYTAQDVADCNREIVILTNTIQASTEETTKAANSIAYAAQDLAMTAKKLQDLINIFILDKNR